MGLMNRGLLVGVAVAFGAVLSGCLERRVSITSEPPGALVTANDVELGRTPCEASFTFYGSYDVRVELEGYEPQRLKVVAQSPLYEYPPFDLVAIVMPWQIENVVPWHFKLERQLESVQPREQLEAGLLERAQALRAEVPSSLPKPKKKAADPPDQSTEKK
jgi:hypothetical protein